MRAALSLIVALGLMAPLGCTGESTSTNKASSSSKGSTNAANGSDASEDVGEVLAKVNGTPIGSNEFIEAASRRTSRSGSGLSVEEKNEVLDRLIDDVLLYEEALKRGLDKDPKVKKVMVNTLLREEVYASVRSSDFTDEELQSYFEAHKDEFIVPEKIQVKRILIKVTDDRPDAEAKAEAERIRGEVVKNPDNFKDLAAKFSEDPYRRRGGDVGFVSREGKPGLDQAVVDKAFELKVDEISPVFKSEDGYNVVTVANRRDEVERTFQQMKGSVLRKVKNERLKELYQNYVSKLREGANVEVEEAKLAGIEVEGAKRPMGPGLTLSPGGGLKTPAPGDDEDDGHGH